MSPLGSKEWGCWLPPQPSSRWGPTWKHSLQMDAPPPVDMALGLRETDLSFTWSIVPQDGLKARGITHHSVRGHGPRMVTIGHGLSSSKG